MRVLKSAVSFGLIVALMSIGTNAAAKKPNVVLIMTDNHGAWTLGCYGNQEIRTPNIDRLAAQGTLFTRAFASNPVCSPTRATFLTGLIPSQHGVHSFLGGGRLQTGPEARCTLDEFTSLPEVLREQGYRCGLVGKWHLGANLSPQEGLDDYWITMPHGGTSTFYGAKVIEDGKIRTEPKYMTDLWTEHAEKFISQSADRDEPFFLFLAYNGPYSLSRLLLREGKNRHAAYYADKDMLSFPREKTHPWQFSNRDYINNPISARRVATEVSGVDDGVGSVMQALAKHGIDENTVVIFVADQGWVGGHGGFFGMGDHTRPLTARDGMMLIPTIWRHPGSIVPGKRTDRMVTNYDFMPTMLSYLGLENKTPTQPRSPGHDYSATLLGDADKDKPNAPIFYEYENLRCIRTESVKYVHRHPNGPHELYDLKADPDEFVNLVDQPNWQTKRQKLNEQLTDFFDKHALPKYDMWKGGTSQVRIHDGIDEELAQLVSVDPPSAPDGFQPQQINVPDGFSVELAAGPPLVTHPTMACFDDAGNLYVCNNAGVNMANEELEKALPNSIVRLTDQDNDGRFDTSTVFADKMTFPMGGAWHEGSLYVASPPNIWRLTDTDDDGIADHRTAIVTEFGYNGNAASVHGCFNGPDGRIYWTDGFHGHEIKDDDGTVTSKRAGSYLFSCQADGSDVQIHCGGGMDNPVEIDFTESGDMLGTVNILYTRPRVDCMMHWLHGGAYPHREKVLDELKVTGDFLGPIHRFGHVAISGAMRYRSGVMDHQWKDDWFATFFNGGKVVRMQVKPNGSSYSVSQHEFLSSPSREFHPTDVLEDADGSLLVIDTGGWFYRGCPTSQFAKPEALGGIYRVRRDGMTPMVDPRGTRIEWAKQNGLSLMRLINDTRFEVRRRAVSECVSRGKSIIPTLKTYQTRGDIRVRQNIVWILTRLAAQKATASESTAILLASLKDKRANIRQAACMGLALSAAEVNASDLFPLLNDPSPHVQRQAVTTLGKLKDPIASQPLLKKLNWDLDRSMQHAVIYSLIEIADQTTLRPALRSPNSAQMYGAMIAVDQLDKTSLTADDVMPHLTADEPSLRAYALKVCLRHDDWTGRLVGFLNAQLANRSSITEIPDVIEQLVTKYAADARVAAGTAPFLNLRNSTKARDVVIAGITSANKLPLHTQWQDSIRDLLASQDLNHVREGIRIAAVVDTSPIARELAKIANNKELPASVRVSAIRARQGVSKRLDDSAFQMLTSVIADSTSPSEANQAAKLIAQASLNPSQLESLVALLPTASPMQLRDMIRCFSRTKDTNLIDRFLDAVGQSKSLLTIPENELSDIVKRYPPTTLDKANALLDRIKQNEQQKIERLASLKQLLSSGNAQRGKAVFFSEKAKCSACHRVGQQGKRVGPELTTIGANRSESDLLESIVLPSASIVRDFGTVTVLTDDGQAISGLVVSESNDKLVLQQNTGNQITIERDEIERVKPNPVSIMPNGLDEALSQQDLVDVVAYLRSLQ